MNWIVNPVWKPYQIGCHLMTVTNETEVAIFKWHHVAGHRPKGEVMLPRHQGTIPVEDEANRTT
jgi:hypothetical protein